MSKYAPREWAPDEKPLLPGSDDTVLQLRAGLLAAHLDRALGGGWRPVQ